MIQFISLHIKGFCSVGECNLQLNQSGITIIRGANGNGKSSIFSALVWCLYGKNLKGISNVNTWPESQPKDYKGTYVDVYFQRKEDTYQIIRCLNFKDILEDGAKGNSRLILIKNAELVDIKGKNALQDEINRVLGMSYSLFMNSIMFGQGIKRLIQESNQDKKKIFEEVFDLEYLNIAKGIALEDRNDILRDINQVENESKILKAQLEENRETYFRLRAQEKSFTSKIKEERRKLKEERKSLTEVLIKKQKGISEEVDKSLPMKIKDVQEQIIKTQSSIREAKQISNKPLDEVVDDIISLLKRHKYDTAINKLSRIRQAFKDIEKHQNGLEHLRERLSQLNQTQSQYEKLKAECKDITSDLAEIDFEIKKLGEEKKKVMSPEYREKIRKLRKKLRKVDEDFHNKECDLKDYDWLISDPLGNNGIKAYIFDSSLGFLNQELEKYSDILGFKIGFEVDLQGARKEFVTTIEIDGHYADYDELSGGQKTLVNFTMALAMHQSLTASKGINVLFLDEIFDSLSSDNIELVIRLIESLNRNLSIFVISHLDSLPFRCSKKVLQVIKENGVSKYEIR